MSATSYQSKVLALDAKRNPFRASITWLTNDRVINEAAERLIGELTRHRNEVAHELWVVRPTNHRDGKPLTTASHKPKIHAVLAHEQTQITQTLMDPASRLQLLQMPPG